MRNFVLVVGGIFFLLLFSLSAFGWVNGVDVQNKDSEVYWKANVEAKDIDGVYVVSLLWTKNGLPYGANNEYRMAGSAAPIEVHVLNGNVAVLGPKGWSISAVSKRVDIPVMSPETKGETLYVCGFVKYTDETTLPFIVVWDRNTQISELYIGEQAYKSFMEQVGELKEAS